MLKILTPRIKAIAALAFSPRFLLLTNTTTGVLSLSIADLMQQIINHRNKKLSLTETGDLLYRHDYRRSFSMVVGGVYFGIGGHFWYRFLDQRFPGRKISTIIKKLLCEMAFGPPYVSACFLLVNRLENKTFKESLESLKHNVLYICCTEWLFYLPLQAINFYFLPPKFRYLFVAFITLIYDNFLSYLFHRIPITKKLVKERNISSEL